MLKILTRSFNTRKAMSYEERNYAFWMKRLSYKHHQENAFLMNKHTIKKRIFMRKTA